MLARILLTSFPVKLNPTQRSKVADLLFDLAKIIFGGSVLGPFLNAGDRAISAVAIVIGTFLASILLYQGLTLLKNGEDN